MIKITDLQHKILVAAQANGGRYHIRPRQFGDGAQLEREACKSLVAGDYARWIANGQPAGIVLTDKALRLYTPPKSGKPT